jgi:hypothetical protein
LKYSENYMFKSNSGPSILEEGDAYIQIDASVLVQTRTNISSDVVFIMYAADNVDRGKTLLGITIVHNTYSCNLINI